MQSQTCAPNGGRLFLYKASIYTSRYSSRIIRGFHVVIPPPHSACTTPSEPGHVPISNSRVRTIQATFENIRELICQCTVNNGAADGLGYSSVDDVLNRVFHKIRDANMGGVEDEEEEVNIRSAMNAVHDKFRPNGGIGGVEAEIEEETKDDVLADVETVGEEKVDECRTALVNNGAVSLEKMAPIQATTV